MSVTGISSMATRQILAELAAAHEEATGETVAIESVGGVDAAKRIRAGEAFDVAVLASDALAKLEADGFLVAGSIVNMAESPMALAVRAGQPRPKLDEAGVRAAMASARSIGISTGPSGTHVLKLARDWGLEDAVKDRIVQAKPGIPVARLLADGEVELGFQQLSEMMGAPGIDVVGLLPASLQPGTVFAAGLCKAATQPEAARAFIAFLASEETAETKRQHGMTPA
ncbi:putative prokaryotic extracellular metal-binding protein [Bradyrhizobium sp. STM 3843]|uniref:substrate-binding domain-containing protein n=1 Tax=Bradyrhizobium sp. STM 3843 TaxID=551947 RepID=UPI000240A9FC|nr:substrate-binding domain-containing protein [Bradyrhizobium sp. STM 3843]CCE05145.1 putative prokaryotic extracellular metal-binding protein [Bradyrhizobium sp. STM 3843]